MVGRTPEYIGKKIEAREIKLVALGILIFAMTLISVPVAAFFPSYAIYFFAPRYLPQWALRWPPPEAPGSLRDLHSSIRCESGGLA